MKNIEIINVNQLLQERIAGKKIKGFNEAKKVRDVVKHYKNEVTEIYETLNEQVPFNEKQQQFLDAENSLNQLYMVQKPTKQQKEEIEKHIATLEKLQGEKDGLVEVIKKREEWLNTDNEKFEVKTLEEKYFPEELTPNEADLFELILKE